MDIETLAVAAVKTAIAKTDYLSDYIKDKDREPMWDGAIYAYSSKEKRNSDWFGSALVQIKGKNIKKNSVNSLKYDLEINDLVKYKSHGGLLFFVVSINSNGETDIFYKALTPYIINELINFGKEQKTIRTEFCLFPKQPNDICNVVMDFISDCKKQAIFTNNKIPTLNEFVKSAGKDISYNFEISNIGYKGDNSYRCFIGREMYLYARNTKLYIDFPVKYIKEVTAAIRDVNMCVKISDKIYYDKYNIIYRKNGFEVCIGKSTIIYVDTLKRKVRLDYKLSGNIREQIQDINFINDFLREKKVNINGIKIPINPSTDEFKSINLEETLQYQKKIIIIDDMLRKLGVEKALNLNEVTEKEQQYLKMLMIAFIEKRTISFNNKKEMPPVARVKIGNITILLFFKKYQKEEYIVENFFDIKMDVLCEYDNGKKFPTSKYAIMKMKDFMADNCCIANVVDELVLFKNEGNYNNCNFVLLEIIKAYDILKKESYLFQATRLAKWLREAECLKGISVINYYQCLKRNIKLSERQENEIMELLNEYNNNEEIKASAYILLDEFKMAQRCLDKLNSESYRQFKEYPIYNLMKKI